MAQRFSDAGVTGIDIDEGAVLQARQNVAESPFAHRIRIKRCDLADEQGEYDCLVSNPPYFVDSLASSDARRTMARHADTLSYATLMAHSWRLLSDGGVLSVVIPFDCKARLETEAVLTGFFKTREWAVKTTPTKSPRRYLLAFRKHSQELEQGELVIGSEAYVELTKDFYL